MGAPEGIRWLRAPDALHRFTLAGAVVLAPGEADAIVLAGPGADVWDLLGEPTSIAQMSDELSARYGARSDVVATDVSRLVEELRHRHLVVQAP